MLTLDSIRDIQVCQSKAGYRFSMDALLVFSFVSLQRVKTIADLGAGSGVIGLLLAKRYTEAQVTLIELQESLYRLAERNIALNNLENRVRAIKADIRDLGIKGGTRHAKRDTGYDLVVSNPPFRRTKTGLISVGDERAIARHEIKLSLEDIMGASASLLKHHGRLCMIHLPERLAEIISAMRTHSLEPKRIRFVHSTISTEAKMVLIEGVKESRTGLKVEQPLAVYNEDGFYTEEINALYRG